MINEQLSNYIKQQLEQKVDKDQIKNSLISNGWQTKDIDEVFFSLLNPLAEQQPIPQPIPQPPTVVTSLPNAVELFKQSLLIYKQKLGIIMGVMAIPFLITLLEKIFNNTSATLTQLIPKTLLLPILIIVPLWGQIALLYAIKDNREKISIVELYKQSWHKIYSYLKVSGWQITMTLAGLFLLIIPGIIFSVWYSLAGLILVFEELGEKDALLKSREYVKNHWVEVFGRLLFIIIISTLIYFLPNLINAFVQVPLISEINTFIFLMLFIPLVTIYLFLIYQNLKTIKGEFSFAPSLKDNKALNSINFLVVIMFIIFIFLLISFYEYLNLDQIEIFLKNYV